MAKSTKKKVKHNIDVKSRFENFGIKVTSINYKEIPKITFNKAMASKGVVLALATLLLLFLGIFLPWFRVNFNLDLLGVKSGNVTFTLSGKGLDFHIDENFFKPITDEILNKIESGKQELIDYISSEIDKIIANLGVVVKKQEGQKISLPELKLDEKAKEQALAELINTPISTQLYSAVDIANGEMKSKLDTEAIALKQKISDISKTSGILENDTINDLLITIINKKKEEILQIIDSRFSELVAIIEGKFDKLDNSAINKELVTKFKILKKSSIVLVIMNLLTILTIMMTRFVAAKKHFKTSMLTGSISIILAQLNFIVFVLLFAVVIGLYFTFKSLESSLDDIKIIDIAISLKSGIFVIGISAILLIVSSIVNVMESYTVSKVSRTRKNEVKRKTKQKKISK